MENFFAPPLLRCQPQTVNAPLCGLSRYSKGVGKFSEFRLALLGVHLAPLPGDVRVEVARERWARHEQACAQVVCLELQPILQAVCRLGGCVRFASGHFGHCFLLLLLQEILFVQDEVCALVSNGESMACFWLGHMRIGIENNRSGWKREVDRRVLITYRK